MDVVPKDVLAGYGNTVSKKFSESEKESAKKFYAEMREKTSKLPHERAKARLSKEGSYYVISWMEAGLSSATPENLLALTQEYNNNIGRDLKYDGVKSGSEIVVFHPNQIKSVDNSGEFNPADNNIYKALRGIR
jgi:hypothetical protein